MTIKIGPVKRKDWFISINLADQLMSSYGYVSTNVWTLLLKDDQIMSQVKFERK